MRLIDADELWEKFSVNPNTGERYRTRDCDNFPVTVKLEAVQREIRNAPTVNSIKHGRIVWKDRCTGGYEYKNVKCHNCGAAESIEIRRPLNEKIPYCSECGKRLCSRSLEYCPTCGVKIDLE